MFLLWEYWNIKRASLREFIKQKNPANNKHTKLGEKKEGINHQKYASGAKLAIPTNMEYNHSVVIIQQRTADVSFYFNNSTNKKEVTWIFKKFEIISKYKSNPCVKFKWGVGVI